MLSLFKNDLKQLKNYVVIYMGCLLLNFIINVLSYHKDLPIFTFYFIVFVFSLILPIINLKYLFNTTRQTHFNSLPFSRIQSFLIHYLSGIVCLIIPAILYCFLSQGIILNNSIALILMIFMYYTLANLTAYLTTSFFMNVVLQVVIILAPLIFYYSLFAVYTTFIKGIISSGLSLEVISYLVPVIRLIIASTVGLEWNFCLIYLGYIIITLILGLYVCKYRNCSNNYYGFTNKGMAQIISIVIIISGSWMLTSVLGVASELIRTFIMVNIIATVIVTFIVQFIQYKKVRYQLCLVQSTLIIIGTVVIFIFSKGYLENYIPKQIAYAAIENNIDNINSNIKISDSQDIDKIVSIHKQLINTKQSQDRIKRIDITYYRNDGSKVKRGYYVSDDKFKEFVKKIDGDLIKSWNGMYYKLLKQLDKARSVEFQLAEENYLKLEEKEDIQLLKNILQRKLADFENNPSLLQNINYEDTQGCDITYENTRTWINYSLNDPLSLTIEDFYKINAN